MENLVENPTNLNGAKFTKEQFLNAKDPIGSLDALYVVLDDDKEYTKEEAKKLLDDFLKRKVNN